MIILYTKKTTKYISFSTLFYAFDYYDEDIIVKMIQLYDLLNKKEF